MTTVDLSAPVSCAPAEDCAGHHVTVPALARIASRVRADVALLALDAALVVTAYLVALALRFDGAVPDLYWARFPVLAATAVAAHISANWTFGLYRQMWRHASVAEARRVIGAGATATIALSVASWVILRQPASVLAVGGGAAMMLTGAVRFQSRLFAVKRTGMTSAGVRAVVVGAGAAGSMIVREMLRNPGAGMVPVAVLDDDCTTHGLSLAGIPVVGPIEMLPDVVARFGAQQVVLAIPSAGHELVRTVAHLAETAGVPVKVVPRVAELLGGRVSVREVRELRIEDLLGRAQVVTDLGAVRAVLRGRRVLVTGAGGSIGSEIARQVAVCEPAALILLDHDETHLFDAAAALGTESVQVLADIRDEAVVRRAFDRHRPDVVFHAAAHKHVPLLESHPCEAVSTNVLGTMNVVAAAGEVGVERLVFISTDKAVCPTSVMGASKWLGEQLVVARRGRDAVHCSVRFGNVAGSRGSVIPTFARQIATGGPVTVTHPDMTRYFMSVQEAVHLVLQAAALAEGGEVFMLEMGEPVNILALAERMIRLSGREDAGGVAVVLTGLRPGEKLQESLRAPGEKVEPTLHPAIVRLRPPAVCRPSLDAGLERLALLAARGDEGAAAGLLLALVRGGGEPAGGFVDPAGRTLPAPGPGPSAAPATRSQRPGRTAAHPSRRSPGETEPGLACAPTAQTA